MATCAYRDPDRGQCPAVATEGAWCQMHWEIELRDQAARLERSEAEIKAGLSDAKTSPARRRALWADLREVRALRRLLDQA